MTFEPYLHWSFHDEHVLFSLIVLNSPLNFLLACLLVVSICVLERFLTFSLDKNWTLEAFKLKSSFIYLALWRTGLYSIVTFLRLCYVLIAMSFHLGLILVIVASLSAGQLAIELHNLSKHHSFSRFPEGADISRPLLSNERAYHHKTRPRSKSKPDDIFIHPSDSNIARADAFAFELGLAGETERVHGFKVLEDSVWEVGKGKDLAREMLSGSTKLQRVLSV